MDTLYNKSRKIRKLIDKGMTTKQIKEIMHLNKSGLYDILKFKYSERFYNVLCDKLKENNYYGKTTILVDTSALEVQGIVEYLLKYHKVLLHVDVVREMDKYKTEMGSCFGVNIRRLLKYSAEDYNGTKIKVITPKRVSLYTDENLVYYLRKKAKKDKNIVLITDDHALASITKGYGIKYILARSLEEEINNKQISKEKQVNKGVANDVLDVNDAETKVKINTEKEKAKKESDTDQNISLEFVKLIGNTLFLCVPTGEEYSFIVLEEGKIKKNNVKDIILKRGDKILQLFYTRKGNLKIQTFRITDDLNQKCAQDLGFKVYTSIEQIENLYTDSVKSKIRFFFSMNKKA